MFCFFFNQASHDQTNNVVEGGMEEIAGKVTHNVGLQEKGMERRVISWLSLLL
jgi:uncharacterized protein YjbJ (UPF0337 family)